MENIYNYAIVLTGGIATGKSTVSKLLQKAGFVVIDADKVAHDTLDIYADDIAKMFGKSYVKEGRVDRKALGSIIFSNPKNRFKLEQFLHPLIKEEIQRQAMILEKKKEPYIIDIPLFFETKNYEINEIAVVYAPLKLQRERVMARDGFSKEEADYRLNAQLSIEQKKAMSTYVIDNSFNIEDLEDEVEKFITYIRRKYANNQI